MKIDILTLFPEMFEPLKQSILKRATDSGLLEINILNIRDFSKDKHKKCDDYTFGGGPGMLMMPQPIYDAITSIEGYEKALKIYMSPKGETFSQKKSQFLAKNYDHLILLCGHYEGVDERIIELLIDEEISIGDYVLTGGELPAMVLVDAVSRNIAGVLGGEESAEIESFSDGLLEYPQYTKPREFMGLSVPEVLVSGDHAKIDKWRREQSEKITKQRRPDLFDDEK
ncbi:MAG: tRNA (guanosine(37)-N1)-methyltransferase TrmD [Clostridia bacterium]|nr:tRNA (guanosine(37)-N1)-methyltransferase TrmD [Clostridia bacterium]